MMCDWCSWITKDGMDYCLQDDEIEATGEDFENMIGHAAIEKLYPESKGGEHHESATDIPPWIASLVNKGKMDKMLRAGGWRGARYDKKGHLNSPWWQRFEAELAKYNGKTYPLDNHGPVDPAWKVFETRASAWASARDSARDSALVVARASAWASALVVARASAWASAWDSAWDSAWVSARDSARDLARDLALVIASVIIDGYYKTDCYDYFKHRLAIWEAGYGCLCDVDGVFYVYKKV